MIKERLRQLYGGSPTEGFLLPTVIIISTVVLVFVVIALGTISDSSKALDNRYFATQARTAAEAGVEYAISCIRKDGGVSWSSSNKLRPNTDCTGVTSGANGISYVAKLDNWESSFEVDVPAQASAPYTINASGSVTFKKSDNSVIATATVPSSAKAIIGTAPRTSGTIKNISVGGLHTCAVSLGGRGYCWGDGALGQLGTSAFLNITNPNPVPVSRVGDIATSGLSYITTGEQHTCALAGTTPYCWGKNVDGQVGIGSLLPASLSAPRAVDQTPLGGRQMTRMANGKDHSCGIAAGKAYCWGHNQRAQLGNNPGTVPFTNVVLPPALTTIPSEVDGPISSLTATDITVGVEHSCAIADGKAYCWGNGASGQIGNNSTSDTVKQSVAVIATGALSGRVLTGISAGGDHTCAISDGELFCWGGNSSGQLGVGNTTNPSTNRVARNVSAISILAGKTVTKVASGQGYTCAIADARPYCWGLNNYRQLGLGAAAPNNVTSPTLVTGGGIDNRTVTDISTYFGHSCAVADNFGFCWGRETSGQLGNGELVSTSIPKMINTSTIVDGGRSASSISMGFNHTCAVSAGAPLCWGGNLSGQLGNGIALSPTNTSPLPVAGTVLTGKAVTKVSTSFDSTLISHSCAIANGAAYCWGNNIVGQLGSVLGPGENYIPSPVSTAGVLNGKTVTDISAGTTHSCAVASGRAYCWGSGILCQLGNATCLSINNNPVAVSTTAGDMGTRTVTSVSAGQAHSCAVANSKVYCWGNNDKGSLGTGNTSNSSTPKAVSQLPLGGLLGKSVTEVSASVDSTCVVADGGVWCWGDNTNGRLGTAVMGTIVVPARVLGPLFGKTVSKVSAGRGHTCAIADSKAYCWGYNNIGQLGDGTTSNSYNPVAVTGTAINGKTVTDITVGVDATCMIADGKPYCWGSNSSGQLGDTTNINHTEPTLVNTFEGTVEENPETPPVSETNFDNVTRF